MGVVMNDHFIVVCQVYGFGCSTCGILGIDKESFLTGHGAVSSDGATFGGAFSTTGDTVASKMVDSCYLSLVFQNRFAAYSYKGQKPRLPWSRMGNASAE